MGTKVKSPPKARISKITVPKRCNPLAKVVFAEMQRQGVTYDELEHRSGVLRSTFKSWRVEKSPGLLTVEAALGGVGWSLVPVPRSVELLPETLRQGLRQLAETWAREPTSLLPELLAECCRAPLVHPNSRPPEPRPSPLPMKARRGAQRTAQAVAA